MTGRTLYSTNIGIPKLKLGLVDNDSKPWKPSISQHLLLFGAVELVCYTIACSAFCILRLQRICLLFCVSAPHATANQVFLMVESKMIVH